MKATKGSVETLQRVTIGGAACPLSIISTLRKDYGVEVRHAWGMTETSPLGTYNTFKPGMEKLSEDEQDAIRLKQGRPIYGIELKIVGDDNKELPWDGESSGAVKVRGPWVTGGYYKSDKAAIDEDGWFETGDVACMDEEGYMMITDRTKDVIKSGGEWISSIELENLAVDHPKVAEAAVIGVYHPKWTERPLLLAVLQPGETMEAQELLDWYKGKVASWWLPSGCEFVESLPHTATGKLSKKDLRAQFEGYEWKNEITK